MKNSSKTNWNRSAAKLLVLVGIFCLFDSVAAGNGRFSSKERIIRIRMPGLYIHSSPDWNGKRLKFIKAFSRRDKLEVIDDKSGPQATKNGITRKWIKVKTKSGLSGWIFPINIEYTGTIRLLREGIEDADLDKIKKSFELGLQVNDTVKSFVPDDRNSNQLGALHYVATKDFNLKEKIQDKVFKNQKKMVDLLLELGADINLKSSLELETPLHRAVRSNNHLLTKYLLEKGANVNEANLEGKTSLELAIHPNRQFYRIANVLLSHGAKPDTEVLLSTVKAKYLSFDQKKKLVQQMIRSGMDLNQPMLKYSGKSLLQTVKRRAYFRGADGKAQKQEIIQMLTEAGAKFDIDIWNPGIGEFAYCNITSGYLDFRTGPDLTQQTAGKLFQNEIVWVTGFRVVEQVPWHRIQTTDNRRQSGWVPGKYLVKIPINIRIVRRSNHVHEITQIKPAVQHVDGIKLFAANDRYVVLTYGYVNHYFIYILDLFDLKSGKGSTGHSGIPVKADFIFQGLPICLMHGAKLVFSKKGTSYVVDVANRKVTFLGKKRLLGGFPVEDSGFVGIESEGSSERLNVAYYDIHSMKRKKRIFKTDPFIYHINILSFGDGYLLIDQFDEQGKSTKRVYSFKTGKLLPLNGFLGLAPSRVFVMPNAAQLLLIDKKHLSVYHAVQKEIVWKTPIPKHIDIDSVQFFSNEEFYLKIRGSSPLDYKGMRINTKEHQKIDWNPTDYQYPSNNGKLYLSIKAAPTYGNKPGFLSVVKNDWKGKTEIPLVDFSTERKVNEYCPDLSNNYISAKWTDDDGYILITGRKRVLLVKSE